MTFKHAVYILCIAFAIFLVGCTAGISQQARSKVTYKGSFTALQKSPEDHKGEVVMLGGRIIETKTSPPFSELIVLQLALGASGRPVNSDQSEGRFIVQTREILDPEIYQKDMRVAVVGTLMGSKVLSIGNFKYTYPVLEPIEIKLWPKETQARPTVHFGVGVGTSF